MPLDEHYRLIRGPPSVEEYMRLRKEAGLTSWSREQSELAVKGAWRSLHIRHVESDEAVGMGRIIGDGFVEDVGADQHAQRLVLPPRMHSGFADSSKARLG